MLPDTRNQSSDHRPIVRRRTGSATRDESIADRSRPMQPNFLPSGSLQTLHSNMPDSCSATIGRVHGWRRLQFDLLHPLAGAVVNENPRFFHRPDRRSSERPWSFDVKERSARTTPPHQRLLLQRRLSGIEQIEFAEFAVDEAKELLARRQRGRFGRWRVRFRHSRSIGVHIRPTRPRRCDPPRIGRRSDRSVGTPRTTRSRPRWKG